MTVIDIYARRDHGCEQPPPVVPETPADAGAEEVLWVDPRELIIREETRRREQLIADLTEHGVRIIDRPQELGGGKVRMLSELRASSDTEPGTELTADEHAGCPGHAAFVSVAGDRSPSGSPWYGCAPTSQPTGTPSATPPWA
jgi:hypothetical protein